MLTYQFSTGYNRKSRGKYKRNQLSKRILHLTAIYADNGAELDCHFSHPRRICYCQQWGWKAASEQSLPALQFSDSQPYALCKTGRKQPMTAMERVEILRCPKCLRRSRGDASYCIFDGHRLDSIVWFASGVVVREPIERRSTGPHTCGHCRQRFAIHMHYCPDDGEQLSTPSITQTHHPASDLSFVDKCCSSCGRFFTSEPTVCPFDQSLLLPVVPPELKPFFDDSELNQPAGLCLNDRYVLRKIIADTNNSLLIRAADKQAAAKVALKLPKLKKECPLDLAQQLARFKAQADKLASLTHPNIVALLDQGETQNGTPYLVLEFVQGTSLSQLTGRFRDLPLVYFVEVFRQCCQALEYAQSQGIVHNDITLDDLLTQAAEDGSILVKLTDFAKGPFPAHNDLMLYGDGTFVRYEASPEALLGGEIEPRSNIYSLGFIMYGSIMGSAPFAGEGWYDIVQAKQSGRVKPLKELRVEPELTTELNQIIMRCLNLDPGERYQSASELRQALESLPCQSSEEPLYKNLVP